MAQCGHDNARVLSQLQEEKPKSLTRGQREVATLDYCSLALAGPHRRFGFFLMSLVSKIPGCSAGRYVLIHFARTCACASTGLQVDILLTTFFRFTTHVPGTGGRKSLRDIYTQDPNLSHFYPLSLNLCH